MLHYVSAAHRQAEIGYVFHPDAQGEGLATEAARAVVDLAFRELGVHRVFGQIDARNTASARCPRAPGHAARGPHGGERVGEGGVDRRGDLCRVGRRMGLAPFGGHLAVAGNLGVEGHVGHPVQLGPIARSMHSVQGGSVSMPIAITDDHQELAATVRGVLTAHKALQAARALLESEEEPRPSYWGEMADLGWLGIHLPEEYGGSGAGLPELVVVLDELGRQVAPGPFLPTVLASAVIEQCGSAEQKRRLLPGLADGMITAALGLGTPDLALVDGTLRGDGGTVLGGRAADLLLLRVGDDVVIAPVGSAGLTLSAPPDLDPTRRSVRVTADGVAVAPADVLPGAAVRAVALARTLGAAEAVGGAAACVDERRRLRQAARPVRPDHRYVPGHQAPLRQHAGGSRAGHRRGVGRGPCLGRWQRRGVLDGGGHGGLAGLRAVRAQRPDEHPGARGHRLHVGARRPSLPPARPRAQRRAGHAGRCRGRDHPGRPGDGARGDARVAARGRAAPGRAARAKRSNWPR